jgi:hypothetical protein
MMLQDEALGARQVSTLRSAAMQMQKNVFSKTAEAEIDFSRTGNSRHQSESSFCGKHTSGTNTVYQFKWQFIAGRTACRVPW